MLSRVLECFRHSWNNIVQSWNDFYRIGMLSRGLEYFRQGWNAFNIAGMLSTVLEYLCTRLKCILEGGSAF
jgi:hypothetical protein